MRKIKGTYDAQAYASFMAPDAINPPIGTPGDVKDFYRDYIPRGYPEGEGDDCITVQGNRYGFDIAGNIGFGYVGSHAGFPTYALEMFAGLGQMVSNIGARINPFGSSTYLFLEWGDDPVDQLGVRMGADLYQRCGTNCSRSHLEALLNDYRSEMIEATKISRSPACRLD